LRLANWLRTFWFLHGFLREARNWLERLLAASPQPTLARARGLEVLAYIAHNQGDYAYTKKLAEESLAISEELGDLPAIADATFALSYPLLSMNEEEQARRLMERSLKLYQELNQPESATWAITILGEVARAQGDLARARELHEQSVALHRQLEDKRHRFVALINLALTLIHFGELDRSQALLQESLSIEKELGTEPPYTLMALAFLANAKGQPLRAARLLGADAALRNTMGRAIDFGDRPDYESNLVSLRAQLDSVTFETAWTEGQALTWEQAIAYALEETDQ
jgi:non-specific serine/threonine protein kinase